MLHKVFNIVLVALTFILTISFFLSWPINAAIYILGVSYSTFLFIVFLLYIIIIVAKILTYLTQRRIQLEATGGQVAYAWWDYFFIPAFTACLILGTLLIWDIVANPPDGFGFLMVLTYLVVLGVVMLILFSIHGVIHNIRMRQSQDQEGTPRSSKTSIVRIVFSILTFIISFPILSILFGIVTSAESYPPLPLVFLGSAFLAFLPLYFYK